MPITWIQTKHSKVAAIFLPVILEGVPDTFYVQFDTGSPSTLLYKNAMRSIADKYPHAFSQMDSTSTHLSQIIRLGKMEVYSPMFKLIDHGRDSINWNSKSPIRIGTLGADIIDQKLTIFDFVNHQCFFGEKVPYTNQKMDFHPLKFRMRKVMIPAVIENRKGNLIHDSGTSGFELITNKKTWKKLAKEGAKAQETFKVKSWKRELTAYNIASEANVSFKASDIPLNKVTYIEGASFMQHALMRMLRMGGMIGNQLFIDHILILDCRNRQYAILDDAEGNV